MKKLLTILATVGLTATTGVSVVSCSNNKPEESSTKPEIKLQTASSTIGIEEIADIAITNYEQIKNDLEKFTLNIVNHPKDEEQKILEQVGDFDSVNGKFTVKGLHKGNADVIVMAYFQDQDLGENPVTAALNITVTTERKSVAIEAEEPEIYLMSDAIGIYIKEYEQLKDKWENFTLNIVNADPDNKETILKQYGDFYEDTGKFYVEGISAGTVKVTVSASLKEEASNRNLSFSSKSVFANNEITITVKKNSLENFFKGLPMTYFVGYGITGAEFIEILKTEIMPEPLIEYGKDYEVLDLEADKILEEGQTIEVQANKNSKLLEEGIGTIELTRLDIRSIVKTLQSLPVGKTEPELQKIVQKELDKKLSGTEYEKDWFIYDQALVVGGTVRVSSWYDSTKLAGDWTAPVGGESYDQWNLEELNNKTNEFVTITNNLLEENKDSGFDQPVENPELKDKWIKNYFEMYSFFARVFLETNYAVVQINQGTPKIEKVEEGSAYEKAIEELQLKLEDSDQVGREREYDSFLSGYASELKK